MLQKIASRFAPAVLFLLPLLMGGQDPQPEPGPVPPPGVLTEPIKVVCPLQTPDRQIADIKVIVSDEKAEAGIMVLQARKTGDGLDVEVTDIATRRASDRNTWSFSYQPGTYKVIAWATVEGKTVFDDEKMIVGTPGPEPPPDPEPEPEPDPTIKGSRTVLIVYETEDQTSDQAHLYANLRATNNPTSQYLQSKGHRLEITDDDIQDARGQVPAQIAPWLAAAKTVGKPVAVVIVDPKRIGVADSGVVFKGEMPWVFEQGSTTKLNLPATEKAFRELIEKYGG